MKKYAIVALLVITMNIYTAQNNSDNNEISDYVKSKLKIMNEDPYSMNNLEMINKLKNLIVYLATKLDGLKGNIDNLTEIHRRDTTIQQDHIRSVIQSIKSVLQEPHLKKQAY